LSLKCQYRAIGVTPSSTASRRMVQGVEAFRIDQRQRATDHDVAVQPDPPPAPGTAGSYCVTVHGTGTGTAHVPEQVITER
jgi:hypothetical protein